MCNDDERGEQMSEQVKQAAAPEEVVYKKRKQLPDIWRRFCKNKRAVFGLVLMVVIILAGIFAHSCS